MPIIIPYVPSGLVSCAPEKEFEGSIPCLSVAIGTFAAYDHATYCSAHKNDRRPAKWKIVHLLSVHIKSQEI